MTIQEIMARISYDVSHFEYSGVKKSDITVLLTCSLYRELVKASGFVVVPPDVTICGCTIRIVTGHGMEWFVSTAHGVVPEICCKLPEGGSDHET